MRDARRVSGPFELDARDHRHEQIASRTPLAFGEGESATQIELFCPGKHHQGINKSTHIIHAGNPDFDIGDLPLTLLVFFQANLFELF